MIQANELRIGNVVEYKIFDDGSLEWVDNVIDADDILHLSKYPFDSFFRPKALTEELLVRLGFERRKTGIMEYFSIIINNREFIVDYLNGWQLSIRLSDGTYLYLNKTRYVHSVQNAIHSLTNQELTLKPL